MAHGTLSVRVATLMVAGIGLAACHRAVPVTAASSTRSTPPSESLALVLPLDQAESVRQLRRAIYEAGLQTAAQHEAERWVRVDLGADVSDERMVRQWHVLVRYDPMPWGRTMVSLRAVEQRTHYMVNERTRARMAGRSQLLMVSNQSTGLALQAWQRLEQIASELIDAGAESLSEYGTRTAVRH